MFEFLCKDCGKVKPARQFRYIRAERRYCTVCRSCEGKRPKQIGDAGDISQKKSYLKRNFKKLCEVMDDCAIDLLLFDLRKIAEEVKEQHDG